MNMKETPQMPKKAYQQPELQIVPLETPEIEKIKYHQSISMIWSSILKNSGIKTTSATKKTNRPFIRVI